MVSINAGIEERFERSQVLYEQLAPSPLQAFFNFSSSRPTIMVLILLVVNAFVIAYPRPEFNFPVQKQFLLIYNNPVIDLAVRRNWGLTFC